MDEVPTVQAALDLLNDAKRRGLSLDELVGQRGLFDDKEAQPEAVQLAELLDTAKPKELQARFKSWANSAAFDPRQSTMFAQNPSPKQARAALLSKDKLAQPPRATVAPASQHLADNLPEATDARRFEHEYVDPAVGLYSEAAFEQMKPPEGQEGCRPRAPLCEGHQ
jgi:hypothetical protein